MDEFVSIEADLPFQVHQIICLEHQHTRLYGEVIQLLPERGYCWFRPMFMAIGQSSDLVMRPFGARAKPVANLASDNAFIDPKLINLQSSSDLLWPTNLFRSSLDTEVIPFLTKLNDLDQELEQKSLSHQSLQQFVRKVWQANQDKF